MSAEAMRWFQIGTIPLMVWSLIWKGLALWKAARREEKPWFIVLLILNTMGILEIIYLLFFARTAKAGPVAKPTKPGRRKKS